MRGDLGEEEIGEIGVEVGLEFKVDFKNDLGAICCSALAQQRLESPSGDQLFKEGRVYGLGLHKPLMIICLSAEIYDDYANFPGLN